MGPNSRRGRGHEVSLSQGPQPEHVLRNLLPQRHGLQHKSVHAPTSSTHKAQQDLFANGLHNSPHLKRRHVSQAANMARKATATPPP
jgi:hypothetical protein